MRRLPLAYACDRRWNEMEGGGETVRRCGDCDCQVVNLSTLDEETARSLLERQTVRACVSYRYRRGRIVFARTRRALLAAAAAAVLLAAAPSGADSSTPPPPPRRRANSPDKKHRDPRGQPPKKRDAGISDDCGLMMPVL